MSLAPSARLGPYEIVAPLGAGGMGEVYRARDSRLGREVAIKVLPGEVANDPERLRRFEQEAKAASTIHHPNLLTVFDVGNQEGIAFLVTELLAGESVRELASRGPLAPKRVLELAVQFARGLAAAHEQGIVHRDLKPENLFLTRDGVAKILDFGLARIDRPELAGGDLQRASTVLETSAGTVLGTVGYMSPEQVRGERADARSDLFSLGVVLHELLAGANPFRRGSVIESLNAILKEEPPDLDTAPSAANPALARLVARLLEKDPARRFRSAHDLVFALEGLRDATSGPISTPTPAGRKPRGLAPLAALALLAAGALTGWLGAGRRADRPSRPIRFEIAPPPGGALPANAEMHNLALAPDGETLAYVAEIGGRRTLHLRALERVEARELAGTEGAASPFWSPGGRELAFFADGKLKRVARDGGPVQPVCEVQGSATGGWGSRGTIVFSQGFGPNDGLFHVPAAGGAPQRIDGAGELPRWIEFLPDGRRYLFWARTADALTGKVYLGDLDGGAPRVVLELSSMARYAPPGWLLYLRAGALVAQRFDPGAARLDGDPVPLASTIPYFFNGWGAFAASERALAYQVRPPAPPLAWLDRQGRTLAEVGPAALYLAVRLSPDGARAAVTRSDPETSFTDVWVIDLASGGATRLTDEPFLDWSPAWSPDGDRIAYTTTTPGPRFAVHVRRVGDGAVTASLEPRSSFFWTRAWTAHGLFFDQSSGETGFDILRQATLDGAAEPLLRTSFAETGASPSPDGRWLAFFSRESGAGEIELLRLGGSPRRLRVSRGARNAVPRWRADGRELFYLAADNRLSAVAVADDGTPGPPLPLFELQLALEDGFDVAPDGQRFLVSRTPPTEQLPIVVAHDWQAALPER